MVKDTETRALNVLARATAEVTGRGAVYRKVMRVATTKKPEDYDEARLAFDAQDGSQRSEISDRATIGAEQDRRAAAERLREIEQERERANRAALEAEKKNKNKKDPNIRAHVWS